MKTEAKSKEMKAEMHKSKLQNLNGIYNGGSVTLELVLIGLFLKKMVKGKTKLKRRSWVLSLLVYLG